MSGRHIHQDGETFDRANWMAPLLYVYVYTQYQRYHRPRLPNQLPGARKDSSCVLSCLAQILPCPFCTRFSRTSPPAPVVPVWSITPAASAKLVARPIVIRNTG